MLSFDLTVYITTELAVYMRLAVWSISSCMFYQHVSVVSLRQMDTQMRTADEQMKSLEQSMQQK